MKTFAQLRAEAKQVWDKPNPVKNHSKLSPEDKARARARAKAAGRPYPNMVDNIWAARHEAVLQFPDKKSNGPRPITGKDVENAWAMKHVAGKHDKISYQHNGVTLHHPNGDTTFILGGHKNIFDHDSTGKVTKLKDNMRGGQHAYVMPTKKASKNNVVSLKREETEIDESPAWSRKEGKNPEGGLNRKGIASYRREHPGSKLSMAVTTKPSKLDPDSKAAKRRKSFCARMGGVEGPMKKPNGEPTRKALALRKWNC